MKRDKKITDERLPDDGDVPELVCDGDGGVIERHGRRHPPGRRVVGEYHQLVLAPGEISSEKYYSKLSGKHRLEKISAGALFSIKLKVIYVLNLSAKK